MPVRVGPAARALCTLSPRPLQAPLCPTPDPLWASPIDTLSTYLAKQLGSSGYSWMDLQLEAAHPDALPRAEG